MVEVETEPNASSGGSREWDSPFHIVGVGASAGGLEALEKFFDNMRPDSGLAFVVIQHLSPDFKSLMDELLRRHTDIAIHWVEDGMKVEPNSIYLIPPKKEMIISGGKLLLTDKDPTQGLSLPIDTFFRSLAQDAGDLAIGVVLSGTGSDGSRGIREIHESGGLVIVQSIETAKFDGMPRSSIDTGIVDAILPPQKIPSALLNYVSQPRGMGWSQGDGREPPSQNGMETVMQATNEELVASNEKLQSTNEELHSVNEELYTVNAEYQRKIGELEQMSNDMDSLLASTEIGVMFLDQDLCIRKFTSRIGQFFDLLPQDVGRRISTFAHNIVHDGLMADIQTVLDTRKICQRQVRDTRDAWYLLRVLPYLGKNIASGVVVTIVDVSTLKQTESQLQRMSKVFMDGADPIILEDMESRILDVNYEAERIYGWKREELIGKSIELLVPASGREASRRLRAKCRQQEHVRNVETVRQAKDGSKLPVLLTLSLLTEEDGHPVALASIAKDIKRLKDAERQAREAVRRRDHFLAILSHELRNPLAAIINASRLLDRVSDKDPETVGQACDVILRQGGQMSRLLDDLLDVSRVTQGKIQLRQSVCDVTRMIDDAIECLQPRIKQRQHELTIEVQDRPLFVRGDCSRLLQIQMNLLSNAVKYTPSGGKIQVTVHRDGSQAVLAVRDNGRGIPASMLNSIFDLFVQTDDPRHQDEGGMGVGLTLVQQLVELHGGTIKAASAGPDQGSEFVVRLPLTDQRPSIVDASPLQQPHKQLRVLIVEDDRDNREMLRQLMELDGHQVLTAADGAEGLQAIVEHRPQVALIDLHLPVLNGYEVARRARANQQCRGVRLIALTGYGGAKNHQAVLQAGFDLHLVKPVSPEKLLQALTR